jgi:hypothetical protein
LNYNIKIETEIKDVLEKNNLLLKKNFFNIYASIKRQRGFLLNDT